MKKLVIVAIVFFVLAGTVCLYTAFDLRQQRNWFHSLYTEWDLFEADYTEDIKNINKLRDDLEWHKEIRNEWERIAIEFKEEAIEYKRKYREQYTINNVGLLSEE